MNWLAVASLMVFLVLFPCGFYIQSLGGWRKMFLERAEWEMSGEVIVIERLSAKVNRRVYANNIVVKIVNEKDIYIRPAWPVSWFHYWAQLCPDGEERLLSAAGDGKWIFIQNGMQGSVQFPLDERTKTLLDLLKQRVSLEEVTFGRFLREG